MLRRPGGTLSPGPAVLTPGHPSVATKLFDREVVSTRPSRGLEQFFTYLRGQAGLSILDLSSASQENINFITNLGHKLYSEDLVRSLDDVFGGEDQTNTSRIDQFLRQTLNFENERFDGVLVWDVLQYMTPTLLAATLERLRTIVRPQSYLLTYFHSDEKAQQVPFYSFRIKDQQHLLLAQRGTRKPAQIFNNRSLEKLFQKFESVKFFLTREQLREVIVRR
jgi:Methyltransferase domain